MLQAVVEDRVKTKSFHGARGGAEHFISVVPPMRLGFEEQIAFVQRHYAEAMRSLGLSPCTAVFRRLFLSDALNQAASIRACGLADNGPEDPVAVSIVQQPPLPDSKLALLAYHIDDPSHLKKERLSIRHLIVNKNGQRHLWSTRLCAAATNSACSSEIQTRGVLVDLTKTLTLLGANLRHHCVRTWIYLRNVDVFYQGMVKSRRQLFAQQGLRSDTHYIASTGIEGACSHRFDVVAMDAYSHLDLVPGQRSFLNDFDLLCATKEYGVTFERGTKIAYADRAHYFISGTASIDKSGEIVHRGNVLKQLDRALLNVEALLRSGGAHLGDMMHWIVYVRDPTDYARVADAFGQLFSDVPTLIVQGAVCRPEWLVEVEGIAVAPNDEPSLPAF